MEVILAMVGIIVGLTVGFVLGRFGKKPNVQTLGTLQLDHSDPDMPYLFLLDYNLDYIATQKHATFEVKVENIISRE